MGGEDVGFSRATSIVLTTAAVETSRRNHDEKFKMECHYY